LKSRGKWWTNLSTSDFVFFRRNWCCLSTK
jgi:hypothetical protein